MHFRRCVHHRTLIHGQLFSYICGNNMLAPCTREGENGSFNLFNTNMLCTLQCVSLFAAKVTTGSSHSIMSEFSRMILRGPWHYQYISGGCVRRYIYNSKFTNINMPRISMPFANQMCKDRGWRTKNILLLINEVQHFLPLRL